MMVWYPIKPETWVKNVDKLLFDLSIPVYMHEGIHNYLIRGIRPGSFLEAVFKNDFVGAVARADSENKLRLRQYVEMLHHLPFECWGNTERYTAWLFQKGALGKFERQKGKENEIVR